MANKVTIKDVAREANVSVGTVSKILNGGKCADERHERVYEAIKSLNYQPNVYARAVRSAKSNCIGLLLEKNVYRTSNLWLDGWLSSLLQAIAKTNFRSEIITVDSQDANFDCSRFLQFDGLISFGHFYDQFWQKMDQQCNVPLVTYFEQAKYKYGFTYPVELEDGMQKIARHLYDCGHREIAFVADQSDVARFKMKKFGEAMTAIYPEYNHELLISAPELNTATEFGMYLTNFVLSNFPNVTTIFYVSDSYANGGLCTLMQQRLRIAQEISIVSYDHTSWTENFMPKITGVGINFRKTTQKLVDLLIATIKEETETVHELKQQSITLEYFPGNSVKKIKSNIKG